MYQYKEQRAYIFTEKGQIEFLRIRDHVQDLLTRAGAVRMDCATHPPGRGSSDSWDAIACVDRLVELKELREITPKDTIGQHRIFVSTKL